MRPRIVHHARSELVRPMTVQDWRLHPIRSFDEAHAAYVLRNPHDPISRATVFQTETKALKKIRERLLADPATATLLAEYTGSRS